MAIDLHRIVNCVRDDLKKAYADNPSAIWKKPFIVVVNHGGAASEVDGGLKDGTVVGWLREKVGEKEVEAIVVGQMGVKYGEVIDPTTGEKVVMEKAIIVTARNFSNGRTIVSITPAKEHRDYRSVESIESSPKLIVPGVSSPDITKAIKDEMGVTKGWLTSQFGTEKVMDSRKGERCVMDPIIQGVMDAPTTGGLSA